MVELHVLYLKLLYFSTRFHSFVFSEAQSLIELMNTRYFEPMKQWEDGDMFVPKQLPWYPYAFQTPMSRATLRSRPLLKNFHNFLITEAELVFIFRIIYI